MATNLARVLLEEAGNSVLLGGEFRGKAAYSVLPTFMLATMAGMAGRTYDIHGLRAEIVVCAFLLGVTSEGRVNADSVDNAATELANIFDMAEWRPFPKEKEKT